MLGAVSDDSNQSTLCLAPHRFTLSDQLVVVLVFNTADFDDVDEETLKLIIEKAV